MVAEQLATRHHDSWVQAFELFETKPQRLHRTGRVVLRDDVRMFDELVDQRATFVGLDIHTEAPLRPVRRSEGRTHLRRHHDPNEVRIGSALDLDHVRTVLCKQARGFDAHTPNSKIENPQTFERPRRRGPFSSGHSTRISPDLPIDLLRVLVDLGRSCPVPHAFSIEFKEARRERPHLAGRKFSRHEGATRSKMLVLQNFSG